MSSLSYKHAPETREPALQFTSKADTLTALAFRLKHAKIPPLRSYTVETWHRSPEDIVREVQASFAGQSLAIRSSAAGEDSCEHSMAGAYTSLLHVRADDRAALQQAIAEVCGQMKNLANDAFCVQPMVEHTVMSGVVMTRDMATHAPYYVLNYDDETGRTDTVTGGLKTNKTVYILRDDALSMLRSSRMRAIIAAVQEIEALSDLPLDIEFALDANEQCFILQVRPMTSRAAADAASDTEIYARLHEARAALETRMQREKKLYGTMPDWNPAELIGQTPKALALSLFDYCIGAQSWWAARARMGYRTPADKALLAPLLGHPMIDVRASFESVVPAALPDALAHRLVDAWLHRLEQHPHWHDKVEFAITQSVYDFTFARQFAEKTGGNFSEAEARQIHDAVRALTLRALSAAPDNTLDAALAELQACRATQGERPLMPLARQPLEPIAEEARRAAESFATVARHAFMAESILRSALARGAVSPERVQQFRSQLPSVTRGFQQSLLEAQANGDAAAFIQAYGHLRPGSFDIESPRYAERWQQLRAPEAHAGPEPSPFRWNAEEDSALRQLLAEAGLDACTPERLQTYIAQAISGREEGKFIFSRSLSDLLELLAMQAEAQGMTRAQAAHLPLALWQPPFARETIREEIGQRQTMHRLASSIRFPAVIASPQDVMIAPLPRAMPNLFGTGVLRAPVHMLHADDDWSQPLAGKIVCIESADPGYDWIFGAGVAGLITQYGGANSHMAIRCMETRLPAAIGCGEQLYSRILDAGAVELHFEQRTVRPLYDH